MKQNACITLVLGPSLALALLAADCRSAEELTFLPNGGQWPDQVRASVTAGPLTAWFEPAAITLAALAPANSEQGDEAQVAALRFSFLGADASAQLRGEQLLPGRHNLLRGADPSGWVTGLEAHARQRWVELYPGVDLLALGDEGRLRYDLQLQPGAELDSVRILVEGANSLHVDADGSLLMATDLGVLVQPAPITWQVLPDGQTRRVACDYKLLAPDCFGFVAPDLDPNLPLVVDPTLEWATYLGGSSIEYVFASALDGYGRAVLAGFTTSVDYPTTLGSYVVSLSGSRDAFVSCISADGSSLVYSTLLGGMGMDEARALEVAADGSLVVGGLTASGNFPTLGATWGKTFSGGGSLLGSDGFVSLLDSTGSYLLASGYVGGSQDEYVTAVGFGPDQRVHFGGLTQSSNLPVTPGAFDTSYAGGTTGGDGFFGRLGSAGATLEVLSYLGGSADDMVAALVVEPDGRLTVVGWSASADFPVSTGAAQSVIGGYADAVLSTFDSSCTVLDYGTFLGGASDEAARAVALDDSGRLVIGGTSRSYNFPTSAQATDASQAGGTYTGDGFLARLSSDGSEFDFATLLGGAGDDAVNAVAVLPGGLLAAVGQTASADLVTTVDAFSSSLMGSLDVVIAVYEPTDGALVYASYLGGSQADRAWAVEVDDGALLLSGYTTSADLPVTAGALDMDFSGTSTWITDGWCARLDLELAVAMSEHFTDLGYSVSGSTGLPRMGVTGSLAPLEGGALHLSEGKPHASGLLLLAGAAGYIPTHGGVCVPAPILVVLPFRTGGTGEVSFAFNNPGDLPSGASVYAHAWIVDDAGPVGWSAANAVQGLVP